MIRCGQETWQHPSVRARPLFYFVRRAGKAVEMTSNTARLLAFLALSCEAEVLNYLSRAILLRSPPAAVGDYCLVGEKYSDDFLWEQHPVKVHMFVAFAVLSIRNKAKEQEVKRASWAHRCSSKILVKKAMSPWNLS